MITFIFYSCLLVGSFDSGFCWFDTNVPPRRNPIYNHLGTKSLYFLHPIATAHYPLPVEVDTVTKGYEAIHIDALYRHGTRYPSKENVCAWKATLLKLVMFDPRNKTMNILKKWNLYFPEKLSYTLHETGWEELRSLAKQWAILAGSLFDKIAKQYKNNQFDDFDFLVFSSPKARVVASADAFMWSLMCNFMNTPGEVQKPCNLFEQDKFLSEAFTREVSIFGSMKMKINKMHMRPFDNCRKYARSVGRNVSALAEYRAFIQTEEFNEVRLEISKLFPGSSLKKPDVIILFQLCSFLLVLHENDRICKLFADEHLKVLEFANDLRHYYTTGYGYHINYHLACQLLQDILNRMDNVKSNMNNGRPSVVLRFGHAETLIPLLCLIGLYKDDMPLTSASYEFHKSDRLFRTGTFSPFAGNIAFVLYKREKDAEDAIDDAEARLKIAIVVNGHFVKLPQHEGCYLCDYESVRQTFESILDAIHCATVCGSFIIHDEL